MAKVPGRWRRQTLPRRWIDDLMRVSRGMPIITFERRMNLAPLAAVRAGRKIAWPLLVFKAYSLVAVKHPELRRAYVGCPWPHFYEANVSHGTFALERDYHGEPAVFFACVPDPARKTLTELQYYLDEWRTAPVENIRDFRKVIEYSRWPWLLRRLLWWYAFTLSGRIRAHNFGTFGISVTAARGATALNLIAPVATTLNYGPFDEQNRLEMRLHFDHRVFDGMFAARVLEELESTLNNEMVQELLAAER